MTKTLLATASVVALFAAPVFAGSPLVFDDPVVAAPVLPGWGGVYIGAQYGHTDYTVKTRDVVTEQGDPYYERECTLNGNSESLHNGNKCAVSKHDWDNSPEIQALDEVDRPWRTLPADGVPGDMARYDINYYGIWMNDNETFRYTTPEVVDSNVTRGASNEVVNTLYDTSSMVVSGSDSSSEDSLGVFLGYRHDFGLPVVGAELGWLGDLTTAEVQFGGDLGRVLPYTFIGAGQYDNDSGTVYGAGVDVRVGTNFLVGVKYTVGDFDQYETDTAAVRFAFLF